MSSFYISHCREDSPYAVLWIYEKLKQRFSRAPSLRPHDDSAGGPEQQRRVKEAVAASDLMLVVIGRRWRKSRAGRVEWGLVELEIRTALTHGIPILPVLVDNADPPLPGDLHESIQELAQRRPVEFRAGRRYREELNELVASVARVLVKGEELLEERSLNDPDAEMQTLELPEIQDMTIELPESVTTSEAGEAFPDVRRADADEPE